MAKSSHICGGGISLNSGWVLEENSQGEPPPFMPSFELSRIDCWATVCKEGAGLGRPWVCVSNRALLAFQRGRSHRVCWFCKVGGGRGAGIQPRALLLVSLERR